jgi:AcrR family transcriptional regulator
VRRPSTYHHGDLANALARVAFELVERRGAEEFSLREAAARCGVAVSAAYKHFASKGELLHAVADRGFHALADEMERRLEVATQGARGTRRAEIRLFELGRIYILFATRRPHLFRLMYGPNGPKGGAGDRRLDAPARRISTLLVGALDEVATRYRHRATSPAANKVIAWAMVHGFSMMVIDGVWEPPSDEALEGMIRELGRAVLRSLR